MYGHTAGSLFKSLYQSSIPIIVTPCVFQTLYRPLETLIQQSPQTSHSAYPQILISHPSQLCTNAVLINLYTYPVTGPYCHNNCTSKTLHHSSSYANCPRQFWNCTSKKIETEFYFGSLLYSIIIYSLTSHEKTPPFTSLIMT